MLIAYPEVGRADVTEGVLWLYRKGQPEPVYDAPADGPDFFPGLALLAAVRGA